MNPAQPTGAAAQTRAYVSFFAPVTSQFLTPLADALGTPVGHALDLGCGDGTLARTLSTRGWSVVAVDRAGPMAAVARAAGCPDVVIADARALPFRTAALAAAGAAFVLPHLPEIGAGLRELGRVVAPDGAVALTGWAAPALSPFTGLLGTLVGSRSGDPRLAEAERRTDPDYLAAQATAAGFADVSVRVLTTTVLLPSAREWWTGMVTASFGLSRAVAALPMDVRQEVRTEFLAAAGDYEILDGEVLVPTAALLLTGRHPGRLGPAA